MYYLLGIMVQTELCNNGKQDKPYLPFPPLKYG